MQLPQYPNDRPSAEDIERAKRLGPDECPRRYCRFWRSSAFEWDFPVKAGCMIGDPEFADCIPDDILNSQLPCRRLDPSSPVDHLESSDEYLALDGFTPDCIFVRHPNEPPGGRKWVPMYYPNDADINRSLALPVGACPRRYCWWWRWINPAWDATIDEGCDYRPEQHPRNQDPTWTNREAPCCRRDPTSGVDRYESRDFYFEFDKIDLHQFDQSPPGAGERGGDP